MPTPQELAPFAVSAPDLTPVTIDALALRWMTDAGDRLPPYWSRRRDAQLRKIWRGSDVLKIAVSTFIQKMLTVPFTIRARSANVQAHVKQAGTLEAALRENSGIFNGWNNEISKFVTDILTQDNGGFLMLLGGGELDGPIVGMVNGVLHLDAKHCTRTGDRTYPVRYYNPFDNKQYKIHFGRIIYLAHQPSPDAELLGIGLSPVSCALEAAHEIADIVRYYAEKMGARPMRQILYVKRGASIDQISGAIDAWRIKLDSEEQDLFAQTLVIAPRYATQDFDLGVLDLASTPDGFNRHEVTTVDTALIAAAFGLSLGDLSLNVGQGGQTAVEANLSHIKGYSKGVGTLLNQFTDELHMKVIPKHLALEFDYVDDAQDERRANIQRARSETRNRDLQAGALNPRVARLQMLRMGEMTQDEFDELELTDGRMPNGTDVIYLFYSNDPYYKKMLDLGVDKPLTVTSYDPFSLLEDIDERIVDVIVDIEEAGTAKDAFKARAAHAALVKLKARIEGEALGPAAVTTDDNTLSDGAVLQDELDPNELFGDENPPGSNDAAEQDAEVAAKHDTTVPRTPERSETLARKSLQKFEEPLFASITHGDVIRTQRLLGREAEILAALFVAHNNQN